MSKIKIVFYLVLIFVVYKGYEAFKNFEIGVGDRVAQLEELADFENAKHEVKITIEDLKKDGFGKSPLFQLLVAEYKNEIVGLSFYWFRYSTWKGKFLFLEDFIVKKEFRNQGIGTQLFKKTVEISKEEKCNGMFWQVLDWNKPAINFYKKHNSEINSAWLNGKLSKKQIETICSRLG